LVERKKIIVADAEELQPGQRKLVNVDGVNIAVFNIDGGLHGIRNECPHMGAPMFYGKVTGTMLPCEPHNYKYGRDNEIIRCPWHGWEFDMNRGRALYDSKKGAKLRVFEVFQEDNSIVVYM
jgi:nitrite reductase/ring-hydroxylating ferredoxin subunit